MAGLWERVRADVANRINTHLIVAAMRAYFVNTLDASKGATRVQIRNAMNTYLTGNGAPALSAAEEADLTAIADRLDAQANNTARLIFLAGLEYAFIAAENGIINETKWRNDLGI